MSRLAALAAELQQLAPPQTESAPETAREPAPASPRALARTAIDYVLTQIQEEDDAETLGEAVVIASSALAVDLGLDDNEVVAEAVAFLTEAALTASEHDQEALHEGADYAKHLKVAQSRVGRALAFVCQKAKAGDSKAAKRHILDAKRALVALERSL